MSEKRPDLTRDLSGREFMRWYYLKKDLQAFALSLGLVSSGSKNDLRRRIAAALDGQREEASVARGSNRVDRLPKNLSSKTIIYPGQRLTARLREFMKKECGQDFVFDRHMRDFFASEGKKTLGQAVQRWKESRSLARGEIESQFEYNRFVKAWFIKHPQGKREEMLKAWRNYKDHPH